MASFSVVSNIASVNAQANLLSTNTGLNKALNRLSSGFRINMSGDDAAGLAVANRYRRDLAIISQGIRNANDGLSELQIKDGALNNISTLLDRLATLATQSASGLTTAAQRTILDAEATDLLAEIDREAQSPASTRTPACFSVFVSNDTRQRDASRRRRPSTTWTRTVSASTRWTSRPQADAQTALGADHDRDRHPRRRAEPGRYPAEPPPVRHHAGAVADDQQEGRREPHPRREHRGGVGEHDAVQHPEPDRHCRPGAGEPGQRRRSSRCSGSRRG